MRGGGCPHDETPVAETLPHPAAPTPSACSSRADRDAHHKPRSYHDHRRNHFADNDGSTSMHALDAGWRMFLVALFLDRLLY